MTGELIHIPLRMYTQQVNYQNLMHGPSGPGLYKIEVTLTKLTTDEILERLREKLSAPVVEEPSERVLGCDVAIPHGPHQIWVENPDWRDKSLYSTHNPPPQFLVQMCPGSDG